jgi:hypothetical protein
VKMRFGTWRVVSRGLDDPGGGFGGGIDGTDGNVGEMGGPTLNGAGAPAAWASPGRGSSAICSFLPPFDPAVWSFCVSIAKNRAAVFLKRPFLSRFAEFPYKPYVKICLLGLFLWPKGGGDGIIYVKGGGGKESRFWGSGFYRVSRNSSLRRCELAPELLLRLSGLISYVFQSPGKNDVFSGIP